MDMTDTIIPKSDQLNAEDLLSGPRTVTITEVHKGASAEQPVDIVLAEFGTGRPFKPSKTVRRILVAAWGPDAATYAGRRLTIYRDPAVRFGGQDVGGIRISHMSGIDKPLTIALTVTRGKRAPHVVKPLADAPPAPAPAATDGITPAQSRRMFQLYNQIGIGDRDERLADAAAFLDRDIASSNELTKADAVRLIDYLELRAEGEAE